VFTIDHVKLSLQVHVSESFSVEDEFSTHARQYYLFVVALVKM
jgi:hypothetical protein